MRCCHLPAAVESTENVHAKAVRAAAATLSAASHSGDMRRTRFSHTLHKAAARWYESAPQTPLAAAGCRLCKPRQTLCGQQRTDSCTLVLQHARSPGRTLLCLWQLAHICSRVALIFLRPAVVQRARVDLHALSATACTSATAESKAALKTKTCCVKEREMGGEAVQRLQTFQTRHGTRGSGAK